MPEVTKHDPGTFCWIELATSDGGGAKSFYTSLFGWSVNEVPMGPSDVYLMFQRDGKDVGAGYQTGEMPPNWMSYVSVDDADAIAAKAKSLGGTVHKDPFDVWDLGRMAVLGDPQGGVFAIWQPKAHSGVSLFGDTGSLCWNELQTTDIAAARDFYTNLFGWRVKVSEGGEMPYTEWMVGDRAIGGGMNMQAPPGTPPYWLIYIAVDDCDASASRAQSLGARVLVEPMDVPGVGKFSVLMDPQGAAFAIIKLDLRQHA